MALLKYSALWALLLLLILSPALVKAQETSRTALPDTQSSSLSAKSQVPVPTQEPSPNDRQLQSPATNENSDRLPFMADTDRESHEAAPSTTGLMLRTLGALLLIIGLIVAAAWGMKRFGGPRFGIA